MDENDEKSQASRAGSVMKDVSRKTAKNAWKLVKSGIGKVFSGLGIKILIGFLILILAFVAFSGFLKIIRTGKSEDYGIGGKKSVYETLNILDVGELVTVNGNLQNGYSLTFVEDIDEKLEEVLKVDKDGYSSTGIDNISILKEYIKAEIVTQFPNLGDGVSTNKLPNLQGVDIINESIKEEVSQVNSMNGFLMLGDSFTVGIQATGMLSECTFKCMTGVAPSYWLNNDKFNTLPAEEDVKGVCVLLGVNNLSQTTQMKNLINKLCDKYKNKPIYIQKVFPLGANKAGNATMDDVNKYNQEISKFCNETENVYFIDTTDGYVNEAGLLITKDTAKLHPNEYRTLVTNIKNKIVSGRGASSSNSESSDDIELVGRDTKEQVWNFLVANNLTDEATAAVMGNMQAESGIIPNRVQGSNPNDPENGGGPAAGIVQWENYNTRSSRWAGMNAYCESKGKDWRDLKCQLEYVIQECETDQWVRADYWPAQYGSTFEEFRAGTDIEFATYSFAACFERCYMENAHMTDRISHAKAFYEKYTGTVAPESTNTGIRKKMVSITNRDVPEDQKFQGGIKLKRVIPNKQIAEFAEVKGKVVEMTYVPEGVFNAYLNQSNMNVLEVYTLNSNREIVFAKWSYSSDNGVKIEKASAVDFNTVMEKYTMPYDYLMIMNAQTNDTDFCLDLAKVAMESEFVIAIQDEVTTKRTTTTYTETTEDGKTHTYTVTKDEETDSQNIELTYADSWTIKVYSKDRTYSDEEMKTKKEVEGKTSDITSTSGNVTTRTVINKYESGATKVDKSHAGDKFVEIYNKHEKFRSNLEPNWLFESLNKNQKTAKLVDITKYLLYKADSQLKYGVTSPIEVYSEYSNNDFKKVDENVEGTVGWEFTKSWENNFLRKYMNGDDTYSYKSSTYIYSSVTKNKKKYIMRDEIGSSEGNRYYGFVCYYKNKSGYTWQHIDTFKEFGVFITDSENNVYGESQIDVETIDKIGLKILEDYRKSVENIAKNKKVELESYQLDCLVDILYEGYTISDVTNIITKYKSNGLKEDKIRSASKAFDKNARGNARWILFSEGRYCTPIDGEELDPGEYGGISGVANDIIETAKSKLGCTYVWGAHGPDTFDCTGFVEWVFKQNGIAAPWYTEAYRGYTNYEITWEELQPGDVIMLYNTEAPGGIGHAGIYIGDDQYIHCSGNVHISSFSDRQNAGNAFRHVFRFIE